MTAARKVLADVLRLNETERARIALALMDSLSPVDYRDEAAWIAEIERRALRACGAQPPGTDIEKAMNRIWRDLRL